MTIAGALMAVGAVGGFACGFMALVQYGGGRFAEDPWQLWFALYSIGALACLAGPVTAWWFLLPRARWWGIAAMAAATVIWIRLTLQFD
ncbi:hypothetical protein [Actinoplanes sp. CA-252034]|uniref:hypothetical protein n=1 Tax=Actinoplanes sp. CA-252034 TaxID=3239906 RepID=UPI003D98BEC0